MGEALTDPIVRRIGWGIAALVHREARGLSQAELADELGISQSTVARAEAGLVDAARLWPGGADEPARISALVDRGFDRCSRLVALVCPSPAGAAWWWGCYLLSGETGLRGMLEFSIRAEFTAAETVSPKVG